MREKPGRERAMSVPSKSELSLLNQDEREVTLNTHHPVVGEMGRDRLEGLRDRLRDLRDRERTLSRHRRRETKGTTDPRGKSFSGTAEHANRRQSVFAAAIKRVKNELRRIRKFEARRELGEAARRALALRRTRQFSRPQTTPTSHDGMRPIPSRRRIKKLPPEKSEGSRRPTSGRRRDETPNADAAIETRPTILPIEAARRTGATACSPFPRL